MKNHLTDSRIWKLKFGFYLLLMGEQLLEDVANEIDEESFEADTNAFVDKLREVGDIAFELEEEYIPKKKLDDYLKTQIVALLSSELPEMTEIDEVQQTFKSIKEVIDNKVSDKNHLEEVLDYISKVNESKDWEEFVFRKEFIDLYIKGSEKE